VELSQEKASIHTLSPEGKHRKKVFRKRIIRNLERMGLFFIFFQIKKDGEVFSLPYQMNEPVFRDFIINI
tara:strand:- start:136 stop:345 length:210 start_codon:yes stop_codon:yes gene_type:complete